MIESEIFPSILRLVASEEILISSHGYEELAEDRIYIIPKYAIEITKLA
jgi:hypothetical protein